MQGDAIKECLERLTDAKSICDGLIKDIDNKLEQDKHIWTRKRRVGWGIFAALSLGMVLLVAFGNAPHATVELPVVDSAVVQKLMAEKDALRNVVQAYKTLAKNLEQQVVSRNMVIAQYEQQLKALAVSVPPQPVILEEIRREASTDAGFKQMVARNLGKEIAGRIKVVE